METEPDTDKMYDGFRQMGLCPRDAIFATLGKALLEKPDVRN